MVGGNNLLHQFQALGYNIVQFGRNISFGKEELGTNGEIDLYLWDGDIAILVEVKTTLKTVHVHDHIERLEKYRRHADLQGDKRRFVGAVAGAAVDSEAKAFAHKNGMYVIVQSGDAVDIVPTPEGFRVKEW
jgi:hypothetical protein